MQKIRTIISAGLLALAGYLPMSCASFKPQESPVYEYAVSSRNLKGKIAESLGEKQPAIEKEFSRPKIEFSVNYKTESEQKAVDYSTSKTLFYSIGETSVKDTIDNIKNDNINSYQKLLDESKNLSESQKLVLASVIGGLIGSYSYDINLLNNEVMSQEDFFESLQDSLSYLKKPLGTCGHLATHIERFLNDLGIKSATVTGLSGSEIGHAYDISKIEGGTAILDYSNILIANTKNIEKTLDAYQKNNGVIAFQHLFFEDTEFKYRLITKDGRNLLDFVNYNESSEELKNSLINHIKPQSDLTVTLNLEDYLTSFEANIKGFFVKIGEIRGDASSPLEKINLSQIGFKRNFPVLDAVNINPDLSFVHGSISQDKELDNNRIFGINSDLIVSTNKQEGLNLSSRIGGNVFGTKDVFLFYDFVLGAGISYKFQIKNMGIEPYVASQFAFFKKDIGTQKFALKPSEVIGGAVFDVKFNNSTFSIEPYYIKRIWEQGFGGKARFGAKKFGITSEGSILKSDYEFCPDKYNISVGSDLTLKNFTIKADYQIEGTNYDGEKEHQGSLNIGGSIKF